MSSGSQLSSALFFDSVSDSAARSSSAFLASSEIVIHEPSPEDACVVAPIKRSCRSGSHLILNKQHNTIHPGLSREQFTKLAEEELSAYYRTMVEQYGVAVADIAVECWLDLFAHSDINQENPRSSLRRTTISAIADMV